MMQRLVERSAMRPIFWLFAGCLAFAPPARAADTVDLTLVLVTDVSRSIDDFGVHPGEGRLCSRIHVAAGH